MEKNISNIEELKKLGFTYADKTFKKYYSSPISFTSQFYFCPIPLRMDTYSGCSHGCVYCFANNSDMKFINDDDYMKSNRENISVKPTKFEYVKKYFDIVYEKHKNTFNNQEAIAIECLKKKVPIHFGGMSDPFQPLEKQLGLTYRVLELLKKYEYPVVCSTKGDLILDKKYFNLITSMKNYFALQISLIHYDDKIIKELDPNAPDATTRLKMMKLYSDAGIWVACRVQPFIFKLMNDKEIPIFLDKLKEAGVKHVLVEGLKFFSGNKLANKRIGEIFKKITGKEYDLEAYYKSIGSKNSGNDLELPSWKKYQYIKIFKEELKKRDMTFGVADNDLRYMGDTPCCCGVENVPGIGEHLIKHNTGFAIFDALRNGKTEFEYKDIEKYWFPEGTFRSVISVAKLKKKFGRDATSKDANQKIKDMFMKQWNENGKNGPCQQCVVKNNGCGKYQIKKSEILEKELTSTHEQKRLF